MEFMTTKALKLQDSLDLGPQSTAPTSPNLGNVYNDGNSLQVYDNVQYSELLRRNSMDEKNYLYNYYSNSLMGIWTGGTITDHVLNSTTRAANGLSTSWVRLNNNLPFTSAPGNILRTSQDYVTSNSTTGKAFWESPLFTVDAMDFREFAIKVSFEYVINGGVGDTFQVYICRYTTDFILREIILLPGVPSASLPNSAQLNGDSLHSIYSNYFKAPQNTNYYSLVIQRNSGSGSISWTSLYVGKDTVTSIGKSFQKHMDIGAGQFDYGLSGTEPELLICNPVSNGNLYLENCIGHEGICHTIKNISAFTVTLNTATGTQYIGDGTATTYVVKANSVVRLTVTDSYWRILSASEPIVTPSALTNYLINGDCQLSQRGDFTTVSSAGASGNYHIDRFQIVFSGISTASKQTITANQPASSLQSFRATCSSSTQVGYLAIMQIVENPFWLWGRTVTLSAWVKSNNPNARMRMYPYSVGTAILGTAHTGDGTWQKLSVTGVIPAGTSTSSDFACQVAIRSAVDATVTVNFNDYIEFTQMMLNEGSVASPFVRAGGTFAGELLLAQRYYEKSFPISVGPSQNNSLAFEALPCMAVSTASFTGMVRFQVTKRFASSGTIVIYNAMTTANNPRWFNSAGGTVDTAGTYNSVGAKGFQLTLAGDNTRVLCYFHWTCDSDIP
jgi:hypothetical protein